MTDREFWLGVRQDIDVLTQRVAELEMAESRANEFWLGFRRATLALLGHLEQRCGTTPRTAELREEARRR